MSQPRWWPFVMIRSELVDPALVDRRSEAYADCEPRADAGPPVDDRPSTIDVYLTVRWLAMSVRDDRMSTRASEATTARAFLDLDFTCDVTGGAAEPIGGS